MRLPAVRWAVVLVLGAAAMAVGAVAFACSNLATLSLSTSRARPGAVVALTGASFAYPRATSGQAPTDVVVHWQSETGPVLAHVTPDRFGNISATFVVPDTQPGIYVITATQETARLPAGASPDATPVLVPELGTPARASFEVLGASSPVVRAPAGDTLADSSGDLDSTVWIVLTAAFGAVALSLFGGGLVAFIHQSRQAKVPAEARWIPPGW